MVDTNEKTNVIEFLRTYRNCPALWDIRHEDYSDTSIKKQQYWILLEKFRETNPNGCMKELKRKINTLRTNYRREVRRLRKAAMEGRQETSTLYYFKELSFLNSIKINRFSKKILQEEKTKANNKKVLQNRVPIPQKTDTDIINQIPNNDIVINEIEIKPDLDATVCEPTLSKIDYQTEQMDIKYDICQQPHSVSNGIQELSSKESQQTDITDDIVRQPVQNNEEIDTYDVLCSIWSKKLAKMGNTQSLFAEKLINDVLFHGELGLLNFNTSIENLSSYQNKPT